MEVDVAEASRGEVVLAQGTRLHVDPDRVPAGARKARLGVRPEKIHLVPADSPAEGNVLEGVVVDASFIGVSTHYLVETPAVAQLAVMAQNLGDRRFGPGDRVQAVWRPEHTFVVS
jgi:spermidine/putrescine transport system ATP-binding protein